MGARALRVQGSVQAMRLHAVLPARGGRARRAGGIPARAACAGGRRDVAGERRLGKAVVVPG